MEYVNQIWNFKSFGSMRIGPLWIGLSGVWFWPSALKVKTKEHRFLRSWRRDNTLRRSEICWPYHLDFYRLDVEFLHTCFFMRGNIVVSAKTVRFSSCCVLLLLLVLLLTNMIRVALSCMLCLSFLQPVDFDVWPLNGFVGCSCQGKSACQLWALCGQICSRVTNPGCNRQTTDGQNAIPGT